LKSYAESGDEENDVEMGVEETENLEIDKLKLKEESVFELKMNKEKQTIIDDTVVIKKDPSEPLPFTPLPRRSAYLQLNKGYLYLYGGFFRVKMEKKLH
jgi:hypothetical protein